MSDNQKLPDDLVKILQAMPEKGMGYHVVTVTMKDGRIFPNRVVMNSELLIVQEEEDLEVKDIDTIT